MSQWVITFTITFTVIRNCIQAWFILVHAVAGLFWFFAMLLLSHSCFGLRWPVLEEGSFCVIQGIFGFDLVGLGQFGFFLCGIQGGFGFSSCF